MSPFSGLKDTHLADPASQIIWILHSCTHAQQLYVTWAVDDGLLPHTAAVRVPQVMNLQGVKVPSFALRSILKSPEGHRS